MLPLACFCGRLSTTAFMRIAFHWIVSLSLPKKKQTHTFSSFCEKITPFRAAAIPKLVLSSTATALIARLEKLNGWKRLKVIGSVTTQRKSDSGHGSFTPWSQNDSIDLKRVLPETLWLEIYMSVISMTN